MYQTLQRFSQTSRRLALSAAIGISALSSFAATAQTDKQLVTFGHNPFEQGNFVSLVGPLDNTYSDDNGIRLGTGPSIGDVVSRELAQDNVISQASRAALFSGQGTNYAVATATARIKDDPLSQLIGMTTQVNTYLASTSQEAIANNLYIFAPGQNDILDAVGTSQFPLLSCERLRPQRYFHVYRKVERSQGNYSGRFAGTEYERVAKIMYAAISASRDMFDQLNDSGAQDILVANAPSPALYPIVGQIAAGFGCDVNTLKAKANLLTRHFNYALKRHVKQSGNEDALIYNTHKDVKSLKQRSTAYGFSNNSDYCYLLDASIPQIFTNPQVECNDANENSFLYYVGLTLTANADDFIGRKMAATLRLMAN